MERREFLKACLTMGALGAASRMSPAFAGMDLPKKNRTSGKARSVIEIWIWGGPSQLEAFDPKPNASIDYNGGKGAIPTNVDGIQISEYMPELAKIANHYSIIRSMTHPHRGHESATYLMQTGRMPGGGITYPAIGAMLAMLNKGNVQHNLPPYVALTTNKGRFSECGFLGDRYSPFSTGGRPESQIFQVDSYSPAGGASKEEMKRRFKLLEELDSFAREGKNYPAIEQFAASGEEARTILFGKAADIFNLSLEPKEVRERYGMNRFGQSCLCARRLVEAGVPYVTINASGWDTHKKHFESLTRIAPEMDRAVATLISDLHERNLLDQTIVWWTGEFGRTPRIDWHAPWQGGRNHHSSCFCAMVAGGGFAGGKVVGTSDATTDFPATRPVSPADLLGSIYELCGVNPDQPFPSNPIGLKSPILESPAATRLREIYR